jgi:hypothetical protein
MDDVVTIAYHVLPQSPMTRAAETTLARGIARFGNSRGEHAVESRLKIATGAALLSDLPQLASSDEHRRFLACGAFAEGMLELAAAARLVHIVT